MTPQMVAVLLAGVVLGAFVVLIALSVLDRITKSTTHKTTKKTTWNCTEKRPMSEEEEKQFDLTFKKMDETLDEMKNLFKEFENNE